jgi:DNA-binding Lrp family transcriptional regulator
MLDELDRALIETLGRDGRLSFERLGSQVGLSRTAARARLQRLVQAGAVRVEAITHPAVGGFHTFAHLSLTTGGVPVRQVAERVAALPCAPFVSVVAGRFSMITELRTRDLGSMELAIEEVRRVPGVLGLDTVVYTDVVKDSHLPLGRPHSFAPFDLDEVDHRLLALLQEDARMPYAELAGAVGLSRAATRARVLRLLDQGVVVVKGLVNPTAVGITDMCGFQVLLAHDADDPTDVAGAISDLGAVDFLARTMGRCDLIGTLIADGRAEIGATLDHIRLLDGVRAVEAWWHLELVKEKYARPVPPPG